MIYVTSDLHGCGVEELDKLLREADFGDEDYLFILGDVIDRGEQGAEILLWLTEQPNVQLILGNHEAMLLACRFLFDEVSEESLAKLTTRGLALVDTWMKNGGGPTLKGLQKLLKDSPELLDGIWDYLADAPLYEAVEAGGRAYLLVHSGLDRYEKGKDPEDYTPHDLLWARPDITTRYEENATVVFGHTPTEFFGEEHRGRMVRGQGWLCIDTGAACGGKPMLLRLEDQRAFYLT